MSAPSAEALEKARAVILEHREDITDCEVAVALSLDSHAAHAVAVERAKYTALVEAATEMNANMRDARAYNLSTWAAMLDGPVVKLRAALAALKGV